MFPLQNSFFLDIFFLKCQKIRVVKKIQKQVCERERVKKKRNNYLFFRMEARTEKRKVSLNLSVGNKRTSFAGGCGKDSQVNTSSGVLEKKKCWGWENQWLTVIKLGPCKFHPTGLNGILWRFKCTVSVSGPTRLSRNFIGS